jgi:hypothetical protein
VARRDGEWWLRGRPFERRDADAQAPEPVWYSRTLLALNVVAFVGFSWALVAGWDDVPDLVAFPFLVASAGLVLLFTLPGVLRFVRRRRG